MSLLTLARMLVAISLQDQAVAISGDYMQAFTPDAAHLHILDPRTGYSAPGLASATVIAPTASQADALATAVMVLGPHQGLHLLEETPGCEGYLVTKVLFTIMTTGIQA